MVRDQKQDIIKGLGILTVMDYHTVITSNLSSLLKFGWSSSLMLIFFFLAGWNYTSGKRPLREDIQSRCKGLLRPFFQYLVFTLLICGSWIVIHGRMTVSEFLISVLKFVGCGLWADNITDITLCLIPSWFAVSLLLATLLFFVLAPLLEKSEKKTWVCILLLSAVSSLLYALNVDILFWHIQAIPGLTAVMLLGLECKKRDILAKLPTKTLPCLGVLLLSAIISTVLYKFFSGANTLSFGIWGSVGFWSLPLAYLVLVLNYLTYNSMAALLEKIPLLCKSLAWIGRHSLTLLLVHFPIFSLLEQISGWSFGEYPYAFSWPGYFRTAALFFLTLALSFLWCGISDRYKERKKKSAGAIRTIEGRNVPPNLCSLQLIFNDILKETSRIWAVSAGRYFREVFLIDVRQISFLYETRFQRLLSSNPRKEPTAPPMI